MNRSRSSITAITGAGFTYIDDIVEGVVRVLDQPVSPNSDWSSDSPDPATSNTPYRLFNIGNEQPVELLRYIESTGRLPGPQGQGWRCCRCSPAMSPTPKRMSASCPERGQLSALGIGRTGRGPVRRLVPLITMAPEAHGNPCDARTTAGPAGKTTRPPSRVIGLGYVGLPLAVEFRQAIHDHRVNDIKESRICQNWRRGP